MSNSSVRRVLAAAVALAGVAGGATTARASDLYVAGAIGDVYKGDSETGGFQTFGGTCPGPIQALAMDDSYIYAGDDVGNVIRLDLATGVYMGVFLAPNSITAMVMHNGDLLISEISGEIYRVDPITGAVKSTLAGPEGVEAMLLIGDDLYASSAMEGSIWKGDAVSGNFEYFGCGCSGPAQGMAHDDSSLFVGDAFGGFVRYDLATGFLMDEGFFPFDISAMVRDGDDLLLSESSGTIHRINPLTQQELDTMTGPVTIDAMLLQINLIPPCPWDCQATPNGLVDIGDMFMLFGHWNIAGPCDFDGNGKGDITDLFAMFGNWGTCP